MQTIVQDQFINLCELCFLAQRTNLAIPSFLIHLGEGIETASRGCGHKASFVAMATTDFLSCVLATDGALK